MTTPYERTRSVIQARAFLMKLRGDEALPEAVRNEAHRLLRHYPSSSDVLRAGRQELSESRLIIEPVFSSEIDDCR